MGSTVETHYYAGKDHGETVNTSLADSVPFVKKIFAGQRERAQAGMAGVLGPRFHLFKLGLRSHLLLFPQTALSPQNDIDPEAYLSRVLARNSNHPINFCHCCPMVRNLSVVKS